MRNLADFKADPEYKNHQTVVEIYRPEVGLHGFIAIHDTTLGPAVGGTRMYSYSSRGEGIKDVLRLSFAMTYKCALAGVNYGGGKGVIIGDPKKIKTPQLLRAYAEEINNLKGNFITGEDVGLTEEDVNGMMSFSPYFIGRSDRAGDPSPFAAISTHYAMVAAADAVFVNHSLKGKKIVVKGVGKVGSYLVKLLKEEGANIVVSDIDQDAINAILSKWPDVETVSPESAHMVETDIFTPCALGNEFNNKTIPELNCKIICGAANNQLEDVEAGQKLFNAGITYIPDYIANSGGLINVVDELNPNGYNPSRVKVQIQKIDGLVHKVLQRSTKEHIPPNIIADRMAEEVVVNIKKNGKNSHG